MAAARPSLAFVSPPGGSTFMEELLAVAADAVRRVGADAHCHRGSIADLASHPQIPHEAVPVVVPHEYAALQPPHHPSAWRGVVGFGVEHPGTPEFESAAELAPLLGATFEISADSVAEMRRRGVRSERFVLGVSPVWTAPAAPERDVDVVMMATADRRRLAVLAAVGADLAELGTELLLPPAELMTATRPDFLVGSDKWALLARSRLLLNVHRAGSSAFEWVRALEAVSNGCVVLTEASTGLSPLVPGEHLLVGRAAHLGRMARQAIAEPGMLAAMAQAALQRCRDELDMTASAALLVERAASLTPSRDGWPAARAATVAPTPAHWVPRDRRLPHPDDTQIWRPPRSSEPPRIRRVAKPLAAAVDVLCVRSAGDGAVETTLASLSAGNVPVAVHVAYDAAAHAPMAGARWSAPTSPIVPATEVVYDAPVGRGLARNELLRHGEAPLVLVLDAGDEVLGDYLARAVAAFDAEPDLAVVVAMALPPAGDVLLNALVPEAHRLARHAYLGRGYVVRRSIVERLGGWSAAEAAGPTVDHDWWVRVTAAGTPARLLRRVGLRWWRQHPIDPTMP